MTEDKLLKYQTFILLLTDVAHHISFLKWQINCLYSFNWNSWLSFSSSQKSTNEIPASFTNSFIPECRHFVAFFGFGNFKSVKTSVRNQLNFLQSKEFRSLRRSATAELISSLKSYRMRTFWEIILYRLYKARQSWFF